MKKIILFLIAVIFVVDVIYAGGIHFGMTGAIKNKINELDAKVKEKKEKIEESKPLAISNISVVNIGPSSATITWMTNKPATSKVEYSTLFYNTYVKVEDTNLVKNHSLLLTELGAVTTYYYCIQNKDSQNNIVRDKNNKFSTKGRPIQLSDFKLETLLDKTIYQSGESVLVTTKLTNISEQNVIVSALWIFSSLKFELTVPDGKILREVGIVVPCMVPPEVTLKKESNIQADYSITDESSWIRKDNYEEYPNVLQSTGTYTVKSIYYSSGPSIFFTLNSEKKFTIKSNP